MTQQELITKIRANNPQFSSLPDNVLLNFAIKQKPELKQSVPDLKIETPKQQRTEEAKSVMNEILTQKPQKESHPLRDFGVGFIKAAGRSVIDLGETAQSIYTAPIKVIGKAAGIEAPSIIKKGQELQKGLISKAEDILQPTDTAQKVGGYAETGIELLSGGLVAKGATAGIRALKSAKNALSMDAKELTKLSAGKFKKIFNIDKSELETVGGTIRNEIKKMPEKVNELATEFKDILQGNISQNLKNVKQAKAEAWQSTLKLFEDVNKSLNTNQIRSAIKKSLEEKMSFDSPFQKKEVIDKTIEPFIKQIKTGTLKGLEEARGKFSSTGRDVTGKLKSANIILHDAVKNYIKEQLPQEKRIVYDAIKKMHAKLFDVEEILKAKNAIVSGTSKLKQAIKKTAIVGGIASGIAAGSYGIKKLFQ